MYLRLAPASSCVLNTARIDIIEKMGHLTAPMLPSLDAATFYRALDHGPADIRACGGRLPGSQVQLEMLTELAGR
jgi:hypothetical protein